jgi:hypothetical protein
MTVNVARRRVLLGALAAGAMKHEVGIVKTTTSASELPVSNGRASEKGSVGKVELAAARARSSRSASTRAPLRPDLQPRGHCAGGMRSDFSVK